MHGTSAVQCEASYYVNHRHSILLGERLGCRPLKEGSAVQGRLSTYCIEALIFLLLSLELGRCSSDLFLSSRPRTGLATTCITGYG